MSDQGTKFVIDGDIERRESEEQVKAASRKPGALILLIVLFLTSLGYIAFLHTRAHRSTQVNSTGGASYDSMYNALIVLSSKVDSLTQLNEGLQKDNDLLVENSLLEERDGVFYEVQIGSFTDFKLDQYQEELAAIRQEKHDGKTKLLLGRFRSFKKALLFENDMKRLGLKDAFIVGRIDGTIVDYQQAIEVQRTREGNIR